jgi:hypothetical protein
MRHFALSILLVALALGCNRKKNIGEVKKDFKTDDAAAIDDVADARIIDGVDFQRELVDAANLKTGEVQVNAKDGILEICADTDPQADYLAVEIRNQKGESKSYEASSCPLVVTDAPEGEITITANSSVRPINAKDPEVTTGEDSETTTENPPADNNAAYLALLQKKQKAEGKIRASCGGLYKDIEDNHRLIVEDPRLSDDFKNRMNEFILAGQDACYESVVAGVFDFDLDVLKIEITQKTYGVTVSPTSGLVTDETGKSDTFGVVLDSEPTDSVVVDFTSSDASKVTVNPSSVNFSAADWNVAKNVTVTGVAGNAGADSNFNIVTSVNLTDTVDEGYKSVETTDIDVVSGTHKAVVAPKVDRLIVSWVSGGDFNFGGSPKKFKVRMENAPTIDKIVVDVSTTSSQVVLGLSQLTFDASNWNTEQVVSVNPVASVVDGEQPNFDIAFAVAGTNVFTLSGTVNSNEVTSTSVSSSGSNVGLIAAIVGSAAVVALGTIAVAVWKVRKNAKNKAKVSPAPQDATEISGENPLNRRRKLASIQAEQKLRADLKKADIRVAEIRTERADLTQRLKVAQAEVEASTFNDKRRAINKQIRTLETREPGSDKLPALKQQQSEILAEIESKQKLRDELATKLKALDLEEKNLTKQIKSKKKALSVLGLPESDSALARAAFVQQTGKGSRNLLKSQPSTTTLPNVRTDGAQVSTPKPRRNAVAGDMMDADELAKLRESFARRNSMPSLPNTNSRALSRRASSVLLAEAKFFDYQLIVGWFGTLKGNYEEYLAVLEEIKGYLTANPDFTPSP